jgi:hypothetical protein
MGPEIWVGAAAVFFSGGAIGAAGMVLAQWVFRRLGPPDAPARSLVEREMSALRTEVADVARRLHNIDARLDFQEQLLGGSTPTSSPPARLAAPEPGKAYTEAPLEP